jgi:ribonuclease P protein component
MGDIPMHTYLSDRRLRPEERLRRRAEFDAVFASAQSAGNKRLVLHWRDNGLGHPRLGLVVSRRFGGAVQRNRFKRRVREIFRRHKAEIGARDIVVLPAKGPEAARANMHDLRESFLKLLRRTGD